MDKIKGGNRVNIFDIMRLLITYPFIKIKQIKAENKRKNTIMVFRPKYVNTKYPQLLKWDERVIYLFEIKNMPGHCVVLSCETNQIYHGFHIWDFQHIDIDDV